MQTSASEAFMGKSFIRRKKRARNTWLFQYGGMMGVRYHKTTVVVRSLDGGTVLVNLASRSRSSRNRMTRALALFNFPGEICKRNHRLVYVMPDTGYTVDIEDCLGLQIDRDTSLSSGVQTRKLTRRSQLHWARDLL